MFSYGISETNFTEHLTPFSAHFPIDVVIGLKQLANIYKVVVDVHNDIYREFFLKNIFIFF